MFPELLYASTSQKKGRKKKKIDSISLFFFLQNEQLLSQQQPFTFAPKTVKFIVVFFWLLANLRLLFVDLHTANEDAALMLDRTWWLHSGCEKWT